MSKQSHHALRVLAEGKGNSVSNQVIKNQHRPGPSHILPESTADHQLHISIKPEPDVDDLSISLCGENALTSNSGSWKPSDQDNVKEKPFHIATEHSSPDFVHDAIFRGTKQGIQQHSRASDGILSAHNPTVLGIVEQPRRPADKEPFKDLINYGVSRGTKRHAKSNVDEEGAVSERPVTTKSGSSETIHQAKKPRPGNQINSTSQAHAAQPANPEPESGVEQQYSPARKSRSANKPRTVKASNCTQQTRPRRAAKQPRPAVYEAYIKELHKPPNERAFRIIKCLEKNRHPTTSKAEADTAMRMAQRLLGEHNVGEKSKREFSARRNWIAFDSLKMTATLLIARLELLTPRLLNTNLRTLIQTTIHISRIPLVSGNPLLRMTTKIAKEIKIAVTEVIVEARTEVTFTNRMSNAIKKNSKTTRGRTWTWKDRGPRPTLASTEVKCHV